LEVKNMSVHAKRLLFVCYGAGHVNMLVPLILQAKSVPNFEVFVLGLTTAKSVLDKHHIPSIGFKDLVTNDDEAALNFGEKMAAMMPPSNAVSREETVAYLGLSFYDLIQRHGIDKAHELYEKNGRQAFLPLSIMQKLFNNIAPDLLISTNSPRCERAAFMVAREKNIPSVCIVGLFAQHEVKWIGEKGFGSRVCVISDGVKNFIEAAGRTESEVVVTGNPALDRLSRKTLKNESEDFISKKNWHEKKVILWASQPEPVKHPFTGALADPDLPKKVEKALLKIVKTRPDWMLVIRYHPGETVSPKDFPRGAYISDATDDLAVLLKSVDVVITMTSTVGLEGLLLGKPLITINKSVFRDDAPYADMGLAKGVDDLDDLEQALDDVISGRWKSQESLPEVGSATHKVFNIIEELLS
jgi:glycosyltransferase involved in cell wall biosynthesis